MGKDLKQIELYENRNRRGTKKGEERDVLKALGNAHLASHVAFQAFGEVFKHGGATRQGDVFVEGAAGVDWAGL
jgi:SAM-dependent MidA family methyltransferase